MSVPVTDIVGFCYAGLVLIFLIGISVFGYDKLKQAEDYSNWSCGRKLGQWIKISFRLRGIYLASVIHFYDIGTDLLIIIEWSFQGWKQHTIKGYDKNKRLDIGSFICWCLLEYYPPIYFIFDIFSSNK